MNRMTITSQDGKLTYNSKTKRRMKNMKEEKIKDLYQKTFGEVLEEYCILYNEECGYTYGIINQELAQETYDEYNIEKDYPEAVTTHPLIPIELILDDDYTLIKKNKINRLMENLNISKKNNR